MKHSRALYLMLCCLCTLCYCSDQKGINIEVVANEICECLGKPENLTPEKYQACYANAMDNAAVGNISTDSLNKINTLLIKELGSFCTAAIKGNTGISENADVIPVDHDRSPLLTEKECREIVDQPGLYYVETTGDTTRVNIVEDRYLEMFPDGTFSKLAFTWTEGCEFELTFVESNHPIKKDYSQPGDIYRHKVIDHNPTQRAYILHIYPRDLVFQLTLHY